MLTFKKSQTNSLDYVARANGNSFVIRKMAHDRWITAIHNSDTLVMVDQYNTFDTLRDAKVYCNEYYNLMSTFTNSSVRRIKAINKVYAND